MNRHHTVVNLASVTVVLPRGPHGLLAALGRARLIHATNRFGVSVLPSHDRLAAVSQFLFIPLDRFQKALQRPRRSPEPQGDRLGRLAVQIRQLALDINPQQSSCIPSAKTIGKQREKRSELPSQGGDLL